jgi:hypothetical protein
VQAGGRQPWLVGLQVEVWPGGSHPAPDVQRERAWIGRRERRSRPGIAVQLGEQGLADARAVGLGIHEQVGEVGDRSDRHHRPEPDHGTVPLRDQDAGDLEQTVEVGRFAGSRRHRLPVGGQDLADPGLVVWASLTERRSPRDHPAAGPRP